MDKREIIELICNYANEVSSFLKFENVYLYGSYANGTAGKFSDIDVAFIVDSCDEYYETLVKLNKTANKYNDAIEPVIMIRNQDRSGFLSTVSKTGLLVA